ncbi:MAG: LEA type 2 family protein [Spirochaetes bacterium]|nr:LEA type 2 family protein [Spirochaetota bacterium]
MNQRIIPLFLLLTSLSCATLDPALFKKKPEARIEKFNIDSISLQDITLLFETSIKNPYPVGITLDGVTSRFVIEQKQLFETRSQEGLKIPAKDQAMNPFTVTLKYLDIINIVKDYTQKDYLNCLIEGNIVLAIPRTGIPGVPDSLTFPYKLEKKIPAIKPSISIKNFSIAKPSQSAILDAIKKSAKSLNYLQVIQMVDYMLKGDYDKAFTQVNPEDLDLKFSVSFDIELENKTKMGINFDRLVYDFYLNEDKLVAGDTASIKTIGNKSILKIKNDFSLRSFSRSIGQALKDHKGDFHLKGETYLKLPKEIKSEPLKLLFNEKGSMTIQ